MSAAINLSKPKAAAATERRGRFTNLVRAVRRYRTRSLAFIANVLPTVPGRFP